MTIGDVAVLADETLARWQRDALERVVARTDATLSLLVLDDRPPSYETRLGMLRHGWAEHRWWSLAIAEQLLWERVGRGHAAQALQQVHVDDVPLLEGVERYRTVPVTDGAWSELPAATVARVGEADVAVRFGFGLLRGDVLTAPEHGVLSFHPADIRTYRGQGPEQMFWNDDDRGGVTLQRLTDQIDAGLVVAYADVDLTGARTYQAILDRLFARQATLLADGIQSLNETGPTAVEELGPYYSHAQRNSFGFAVPFVLKNVARHLR